jgi:glycosyltransferase involved in cell wall biosynthesis
MSKLEYSRNPSPVSRPLHWWIIEDALTSRWGHWQEYLLTFKRGLEEIGDTTEFFVSRECDEEVAASVNGKRVLPDSIWRRMSDGASKWRRLWRIPQHALATYCSVSRLLRPISPGGKEPRSDGPPDVMFVPTVLVHHMLGWFPLVLFKMRGMTTRVVFFFPNTPIEVDSMGQAHLCPEPTAKLFYFAVKLFFPFVRSGKVVLAAETVPMAHALTQLTGMPFRYLPHPVEVPAAAQASASSVSSERVPLTVGCYGAARWEKGSDILQKAIAKILADDPHINARFVFQWLGDFLDESGHEVRLDEILLEHPKVEVMRDYFTGTGYEEQLAETSIMALPYRSPYKLRVSRVVIEAMIMGMPVVTAADTTLNQQARQFGLDITCEQNSVDSLAEAIIASVARYPELKRKAMEMRDSVRQHFSVRAFRDGIMENLNCGPRYSPA